MTRERAAAVRMGAIAAEDATANLAASTAARSRVHARTSTPGDAPAAGGQTPLSELRPVNLPVPIVVEVGADGEPHWLLWRGQRLRVVAVLDRWRIDDEWWRTPITRLYRYLHLAGDRLLTVYQDLERGAWYAQRYRFPISATRRPTARRRRGGDRPMPKNSAIRD